jgi:two-component system, NarL family, nitrate/nitrite response regulator NarL
VATDPPNIRILLVDDQTLFRRALRGLIDEQPDMTVVGEAANGREALVQVRGTTPDLVVMDVQMPGGNGVEGVRGIREAGIATPIVMLTVSDEDDDLFGAIAAGANGYLLKNIEPEQFTEMLRAVVRGESPVSPAIAHRLLEVFRAPAADLRALAGVPEGELTPREVEVLRLVADGLSNKEIGARLAVTEGTVKNHVHNVLEKLHLQNRAQAAAYVVRRLAPGDGERS